MTESGLHLPALPTPIPKPFADPTVSKNLDVNPYLAQLARGELKGWAGYGADLKDLPGHWRDFFCVAMWIPPSIPWG